VSFCGRGRPRRCAGLKLAPFARHRFVVGQDSNMLTPSGQFVGAANDLQLWKLLKGRKLKAGLGEEALEETGTV
jgi:hypothetical protein